MQITKLNMPKDFETVSKESTCQKRVTICEIYNKDGILLARESNRCSPSGGVCHRLETIQQKDNYDKDSFCNWTHAEINAINALPANSNPYKAVLFGHTFYCDSCENQLKKAGVIEFEIIKP